MRWYRFWRRVAPPWTNTRIAVRLEAIRGVTYVAQAWSEYNDAFLYSLALAAEVDHNTNLSNKQAEVAFALRKVWRNQSIAGAISEGPRRAAGGPGRVAVDAEMFERRTFATVHSLGSQTYPPGAENFFDQNIHRFFGTLTFLGCSLPCRFSTC